MADWLLAVSVAKICFLVGYIIHSVCKFEYVMVFFLSNYYPLCILFMTFIGIVELTYQFVMCHDEAKVLCMFAIIGMVVNLVGVCGWSANYCADG